MLAWHVIGASTMVYAIVWHVMLLAQFSMYAYACIEYEIYPKAGNELFHTEQIESHRDTVIDVAVSYQIKYYYHTQSHLLNRVDGT